LNNYEIYLNKAMSWCSRRELCKSDVEFRLLKFDLDSSTRNKIIDKLILENFINEERYTRAFVNDKIKFQKWGLDKIKHSLFAKKISADTINSALSEIDNNDYLNRFIQVAKQKYKNIKSETDFEKTQKLLRFLVSKGISASDAYKIINTIKNT